MKILHVSESVSSIAGGLQNAVFGFANGLSDLGHDVLLLAGRDSGEVLENPSINVKVLDVSSFWKLNFLKGFADVVDDFCPDLIVQHGLWSGICIQVSRISKKKSIPYVVVPHGMLDPYILNKNSWQKKLALMLFQKNNIDNSNFVRVLNENEAMHVSLVSNVRTEIMPNGIVRVGKLLNCVKRKGLYVFLGRVDHKKGVDELLDAWAKFRQLFPNEKVHLSIAGWAGDNKYFSAFKNKISITSDVSYVGPLFGDDKNRFLQEAEFFILPSKGEGLPTAVLEAWDAGAIVLMSEFCNFSQDVFGRSAINCGANVDEIFDALSCSLVLDQSEKNMYLINGEAELSKFDWAVICKRFSSLVGGG